MKLKALLPHVGVLAAFIILVLVYFFPAFKGEKINQSDIVNFNGVTKEIRDYRSANGEEPLWTNSMFAGQPTFFVSTLYPYDFGSVLVKTLSLGMPHPVGSVFISFLLFYLLMLAFKADWRVAAIAALAYAFSTYMILILEAGHNSKAFTMAFMPGVLAALVIAFHRNLKLGAFLTGLFTALELYSYHPQVTYYLLFVIGIYVLVEGVFAYKRQELKRFFKVISIVVFAAFLGLGTNVSRLWSSYEFSKYTIRGKSELSSKVASGENNGVSLDYATAWSYGKLETFTTIVPNFYGGGSGTELGKDSEIAKKIGRAPNAKQILKNVPTYWGDQPFTSGPVYFGAVVVCLFIIALFFIDRKMLWWAIPATILSILLSWGRNFMFFTELFYHYIPMYNKFRTVSMILVIAEMLVPFVAFYGLHKIMSQENRVETMVKLKKGVIAVASLFGLVLLVSFSLDYAGPNDAGLAARGWPVDAIVDDRKSMLRSDLLRSLFFAGATILLIWLMLKEKLKRKIVLGLIALLVMIDLVGVGYRYLNYDDYVKRKEVVEPYKATQADLQILKDPDPHYRVFNQSERIDAGARTSYFHKSLGGYAAAKLGRYQELVDAQISKGNQAVINMLNAKYLLRAQASGQFQAIRNPQALGNAWFVTNVKEVANADEELSSLTNFDPASTAVVNAKFVGELSSKNYSGEGEIKLSKYDPKEMVYSYSTSSKQLAVFSEIFYPKGWVALVDGVELPIIQANYVLRAVELPAGTHTLTFEFSPTSYYAGGFIGLASWIVLGLMMLYVVFVQYKLLYPKEK